MNARRSLALGVGRDLLFAVLICAVALLASLTVQLQLTERDMRERSLERAAHYIERHLRIDPDGQTRLPTPPGSSWASFGYPTLVFDRDGRLLLERPAGLDRGVIEELAEQRLAGEGHAADRAERAGVVARRHRCGTQAAGRYR